MFSRASAKRLQSTPSKIIHSRHISLFFIYAGVASSKLRQSSKISVKNPSRGKRQDPSKRRESTTLTLSIMTQKIRILNIIESTLRYSDASNIHTKPSGVPKMTDVRICFVVCDMELCCGVNGHYCRFRTTKVLAIFYTLCPTSLRRLVHHQDFP